MYVGSPLAPHKNSIYEPIETYPQHFHVCSILVPDAVQTPKSRWCHHRASQLSFLLSEKCIYQCIKSIQRRSDDSFSAQQVSNIHIKKSEHLVECLSSFSLCCRNIRKIKSFLWFIWCLFSIDAQIPHSKAMLQLWCLLSRAWGKAQIRLAAYIDLPKFAICTLMSAPLGLPNLHIKKLSSRAMSAFSLYLFTGKTYKRSKAPCDLCHVSSLSMSKYHIQN